MRKVRPDGTVWYYYYKKKCGRHKKPGPKKKVEKVHKERVYKPWDFKIVKCIAKHESKYIGRYHDIQDVYDAKKLLEDQNAKVVFPRKYINNGNNCERVYDAHTEYLILKRNHEDKESTLLRNDYGKLVDHTYSSKDWIIYDKFPCVEEETFWVYGYDNKTDRKTFDWIYENLITNILSSGYDIVNVYVYNNKVIFKYDDDFNFVMCKNVSDAIRMYNLIETRSKKNKQVILTGGVRGYGFRGKETIEMIRKKTGWKDKKIWERSTRH